MQRELAEARAAQKNATLAQRADMAKVEHEDFMRVLAVNRSKEHDEMMLVRGCTILLRHTQCCLHIAESPMAIDAP
jgi:hypothetical protein